ncbi:RDD family protein [Tsukamurella soli]
MGRATGSWLSGASAAMPSGVHPEYKGADIGLPRSGVGAVGSTGQRVLALFIDWIACGLIVLAFASFESQSLWTLGLWLLVGVLTVTLFGFTPGQYFAGLRVARIEGPTVRVGFVRALARGVLIVFLVPPLLQDGDGRGMQDRATGTVLVRTR